MRMSVNNDFQTCNNNAIEIFIKSNGVHTDIIVPYKNQSKDWSSLVNPSFTKSGVSTTNYVSFGWGDKGFYLNTPTWAELKLTTAINALFYMSSTAMHVTFYNRIEESIQCKKICIGKMEYIKLCNYIEDSFDRINNSSILIPGASYGSHDLFYEAKGKYSLFNTCNTWANKALKSAGIKSCLWTPFDKGIFYQFQQ